MVSGLQVANIVTAALLPLLAAATQNIALSAELKVLSGSGVQLVMTEIIPQFERISGHKVIWDYGTVGGMADRVQRDCRASSGLPFTS